MGSNQAVVAPAIAPKRQISYRQWIVGAILIWAGISIVYGCSVYMEATRPKPVEVSKFEVGESRDAVRTQLGIPVAVSTEAGNECDTYNLYTHALGAGARAPIIVLESAADFFTLGLAEAVLTPTEMATKNERYPVKFCYKDNKLLNVTESETPAVNQN
jgi:hypothetical protein